MAAEPAPVPPLSSYVAKRCPRRVQLDLVEPGVPLEPTADVQTRLDEGVAFEASVVAELRAVAGSDWVFVDEAASPKGRLRCGRRQAPSHYRRRRLRPVDVDAGRTNTDRRARLDRRYDLGRRRNSELEG